MEECVEVTPPMGHSSEDYETHSYLQFLEQSDIDFENEHISAVEYQQQDAGIEYMYFGRDRTGAFAQYLQLQEQPQIVTVTYGKVENSDQQFGCIQSLYFDGLNQDVRTVGANTNEAQLTQLEVRSFQFSEENPVMGIYGSTDDLCIRSLGFITCKNQTNPEQVSEQNIEMDLFTSGDQEDSSSVSAAAILVPMIILVLIAIGATYFVRKYRKNMPKEGKYREKDNPNEKDKVEEKQKQVKEFPKHFEHDQPVRSSDEVLVNKRQDQFDSKTVLQGSEQKPMNAQQQDDEVMDLEQYKEFAYSFKPTPTAPNPYADFKAPPAAAADICLDDIQMKVIDNPYEVNPQSYQAHKSPHEDANTDMNLKSVSYQNDVGSLKIKTVNLQQSKQEYITCSQELASLSQTIENLSNQEPRPDDEIKQKQLDLADKSAMLPYHKMQVEQAVEDLEACMVKVHSGTTANQSNGFQVSQSQDWKQAESVLEQVTQWYKTI